MKNKHLIPPIIEDIINNYNLASDPNNKAQYIQRLEAIVEYIDEFVQAEKAKNTKKLATKKKKKINSINFYG